MKNSKGFTLIELIALLGIIAIILLISAPSLINQIETTRNSNYNNFISDLCLASESYLNHNDNIDGIDNFKVAGDTITISAGDLMSNGYIKSNIKNPKTGNSLNTSDIIKVTITNDMTYSCSLNS
jgi:competence protein ComGC